MKRRLRILIGECREEFDKLHPMENNDTNCVKPVQEKAK